MKAKLSPSYSHEKLENPNLTDLVDVFEDLWLHYILKPIELLLNSPNGDIAAMTILCSYFEAIAGYIEGKDTNGRSREFFIKGFCRVFQSDSTDIEKAAEAIYKHIRCGLAHEGMMSHKVNYSRAGSKACFLTYKKNKYGSLNFASGVASIIINPQLTYEAVLLHFNKYLLELREAKDQQLIDAFNQTVSRQWALGVSENIVAMTESEFLGRNNKNP